MNEVAINALGRALREDDGAAGALDHVLDMDVVVIDLRPEVLDIGRGPADAEGGRDRGLRLQVRVATEQAIVLTGRIHGDVAVLIDGRVRTHDDPRLRALSRAV